MGCHVGRLYALTAAIAVFFVTWAVIASSPWRAEAGVAPDPRLEQLAAREAALREEAARVQRAVDHRWAVYRVKLERRKKQIAAAKHEAQLTARQEASTPQVQVVTLPPVTSTRSS